MTITVNGTERPLPGALTIDELLLDLRLRRELVAVELNRQIVRRVNYGAQRVGPGDQVEIVEFVGGG
jgi:sulfur carrier protein